MKICGVDMSINSPAIVKFFIDDNYNVINKEFLTFSKIKKYTGESKDGRIEYIKKSSFKNNINQYVYMRDIITEFIGEIDYVAFEGYAYSAKGHVFDIAEATASIKIDLFDKRIPLRIYDPASIKMYATTKGNADKIRMEDNFELIETEERFDLSFLPMVYEKDSGKGNPKDNIVDAFFICKLLLIELKLRSGFINLKDLDNDKQIAIFNRVTKSNPVNILDTDFIVKS